MGAALKYRTSDIPRQSTEQGRIKVVRGPDQGCTYVLTGIRVVLGRGEECDVILSDLRASRKHAEVFRSPQGWQVRDLGSANGIQQGGKAGKGGPLRAGDGFGIGETWMEFFHPMLQRQCSDRPGPRAWSSKVRSAHLGFKPSK
ncbi:MAG: FHA domain-containing protein [Bdellovibrionota bacterium]